MAYICNDLAKEQKPLALAHLHDLLSTVKSLI